MLSVTLVTKWASLLMRATCIWVSYGLLLQLYVFPHLQLLLVCVYLIRTSLLIDEDALDTVLMP